MMEQADPQDPLPESKWLWRRLLTFGIVIFGAWQMHLAGNRLARFGEHQPVEAIRAMLNLVHWQSVSMWIVLLLYMIAPSAEQLAKIIATLSALKSGVAPELVTKAGAVVAAAAGPPSPPAPAYSGPDLSHAPAASNAPKDVPWH
jgi:hypothetical protein